MRGIAVSSASGKRRSARSRRGAVAVADKTLLRFEVGRVDGSTRPPAVDKALPAEHD
jgi:hypothetical protein